MHILHRSPQNAEEQRLTYWNQRTQLQCQRPLFFAGNQQVSTERKYKLFFTSPPQMDQLQRDQLARPTHTGQQQKFSTWFCTALNFGLWPRRKHSERNLSWHLLVCVQLWLAAFYIWKCWEETNRILILAFRSPPYCKSILTGSSEKDLKWTVGRSRKFALPALMTQHSERKKIKEKKEMLNTQH